MLTNRPRNKNGALLPTHGLSRTKIYHRWYAMKERCNNPKNKEYYRYGGRGIRLCDEWEKSFLAFYDWAMKNGYREDLTIERIDNDLGYSPENCRFATLKEQSRNTSQNRVITYNGKTQCIMDWSIETGINYKTIEGRLNNGKAPEEIFDIRNWRYKDGRKHLRKTVRSER